MGKRRVRRGGSRNALAAWQRQNPLLVWRLTQGPEGWNRSVLARQLGVSPTAVASWEKGERRPVVDALAKIQKLTKITAVQWMEWLERKPG